jgi:hypothetical protein
MTAPPTAVPGSAPVAPPAIAAPPAAVGLRDVLSAWWPLAASWLMMGFELPAVSAVMARLPDPEISLAAYGGVVFPLAMLIEAPIIMLLAASTALSRDRDAHRKLGRFVTLAGASLTILHLLIAATPLYDLVIPGLMGAPSEVLEPARLGLLVMTPWTWSIAYRRYQQGLLIRSGRSRLLGIGTVIRLAAIAAALATGGLAGGVPGIVVGTAAVSAGVLAEAVFVGFVVRPSIAALPALHEDAPPLTRDRFVRFYAPLALTSLLTLGVNPIASAAIGRMPSPLASLAAWPVVSGLVFTMRSLGFAFHEVVVAMWGRRGAERPLRRFAWTLALATSGGLVIIAATPLAEMWFRDVSALSAPLADLARQALWVGIPLPAVAAVVSLLSGTLVHRHRTRGVSEAVTAQLAVTSFVLALGVAWGGAPGLPVAVASFLLGQLVQIAWLARRCAAPAAAAVVIGLAAAAPGSATNAPSGFVHEHLVREPFVMRAGFPDAALRPPYDARPPLQGAAAIPRC